MPRPGPSEGGNKRRRLRKRTKARRSALVAGLSNPHQPERVQGASGMSATTVWDSLAASACLPDSGFQGLTEQMEEIAFVEPEIMDGTSHIRIVRTTLRDVWLDGLDDVVNFEKEFVRYEQTPNGKVTAFFADETSAVGDVLF